MTETQTTYTYTDPRNFPGDPFEVASAALAQAAAAAKLLQKALDDANVMARNAEMERQLYRGEEPDAFAWESSALGRKLAALGDETAAIQRGLVPIQRAAGFNPRNPPKE